MLSKISDILEGNFDYISDPLEFSCAKVELSIRTDEKVRGSFRIFASNEVETAGFVYASDSRMKVIEEEFAGPNSEIGFIFDSTGMEEGDVLKGQFDIITSRGEYYLPFLVSVYPQTIESSLGSIKNLFHFTNLAKTNWNEALHLFYSHDFTSVFSGNDRQFLQLYLGLSANKGNARNMEEFLISVNKKQPVEYHIDEQVIRLEDPNTEAVRQIEMSKNGWGYTHLRVLSESGLITFEKGDYTERDFSGNRLNIRYTFNPEKIHAGMNYDTIQIKDGIRTITIPVSLSIGRRTIEKKRARAYRHYIVDLMSYYKAFRLHKISLSTWIHETEQITKSLMGEYPEDPVPLLFEAQILISEEKDNEARWMLDQAENMLHREQVDGRDARFAYHLYLTTLVNKDSTYSREVGEIVSRMYAETRDWRVAWLLLYLSEQYNRSEVKKWLFLEEQYKQGCTSPLLYIEALKLANSNPSLVRSLSGFELQTLYFACKNDVLSKELLMQISLLASTERSFSPILIQILAYAYEKQPDEEILEMIVKHLLKGSRTDKKYFVWYEKAVEAELHLTRLYEYYMLAMDLTKNIQIHRMVLMYFSYHSSLDYRHNARIYAQITERKEELPEIFAQYTAQIEEFTEEQLRLQRMSKDLAFLYKNFIKERMLNEETVHALSSILFMHQIETSERGVREVIVRHSQLKQETRFPLVDGRCVFPIWTRDYMILFEDDAGNRYSESVPYTIEKLMIPGRVVKMVEEMGQAEIGLNLYLCEYDKENVKLDESNRIRFENLLKSEYVEEDVKREISIRLANYYYEQEDNAALDFFLSDADPTFYTAKERNELMNYMIIRGMWQKAYDWLSRFGTTGTDVKVIMRLIHEKILEVGNVRDSVLVHFCMYVFKKGKYDEVILSYLIRFYEGLTKDLRDMWKAADAYEVDTFYLLEKMIVQMLFSGSFVGEKMEIFKTYVDGGAKEEIEKAFASQCAYDFFVNERVMDEYAFEEMIRLMERGETLHRVCKLAIIKFYAEHPELITKAQEKMLHDFVLDMFLDGIRMPYLRVFKDIVPIAAKLNDSEIIEYHTAPGGKAIIHYCLEKGEEESEYREEEMNAVYGSVYYKEIPLFFGERVQYYITEENGSNSQLTESDTLQKTDMDEEGEATRYSLVNDIAMAHSLQDYDTVNEMVKEYRKTEFMVEQLFTIR